jgi:hypothetical protein
VFLQLNLVVWLSIALGWNFDDLPPLPTEDNPVGAVVDGSQAGALGVSKSRIVTILPGVSLGELDPFVEYVPRPVPRAPRLTNKRAQADDTSASASSTKKPHPPSTRSGTQAIGSMLLGERINVLYFPLLFVCFLTRVLFSLQMAVQWRSSRMIA